MAEEELKPPVEIDATNLDGSAGTNGQVLQTDGSNTSWVTPSSETVKTVTSNYTTSGETLIIAKTGDTVSTSIVAQFDTSGEESSPRGIAFNNDGTKAFVTGNSTDSVYQYNLSTAYDLSTASYSGNSFDVSGQTSVSQDVEFNDTGSKMYICSWDGFIDEYSLTTNFDITTASHNDNLDITAQDGNPTDIAWKPDGTKIFVIGNDKDNVYEYDVSTAYDVSTGSFATSFDLSGQMSTPRGLGISSDGKKFVVLDFNQDINVYKLSTAYDISTASFDNSSSFSIDSDPWGGFIADSKYFWVGGNNTEAYSFSHTFNGPSKITLSSSDNSSGKIIRIKDATGNASSNNITVNTASSENIDGSSSVSITSDYGVKQVQSDGSNWFVISDG